MTRTSGFNFDVKGMTVVSQGACNPALCGLSPGQSFTKSPTPKREPLPELGPDSRVPLVYLHRDYHADERSPKLLDILSDLQHGGPVHALRISSAVTVTSARSFVQALLGQFPTIVVLEDGSQPAQAWNGRFYVLSSNNSADHISADPCVGSAALSAPRSPLGTHSPSARS
ncbi:hypothetical protein PhaeoP23_01283 [Phaeobacter piscinae]|uniref:Uncharacterized protein n=1 Tax=Phaeobacter piscinae TaxID=1580596 RepID=A0ABM6PD28_9RHOB|nr:hypothetical protein PhaeoP36_01283 [Phaeobacter piscinae]AUQ85954.1 hypothetical protein PhaeoP42_01283 [Phaeobacter piscinae]AUR23838.1 hypothetical protein PhaeoP23_01283 [Phaeobacter piscinae]UTS80359.1 hypothetical protein OL67_001421 [Phaeobacter piscinae]